MTPTNSEEIEQLLNYLGYGNLYTKPSKAQATASILTLLKDTQTALLDKVDGIIGEDDHYDDLCDECDNWDQGRNHLRYEQRTALRKLREEI